MTTPTPIPVAASYTDPVDTVLNLTDAERMVVLCDLVARIDVRDVTRGDFDAAVGMAQQVCQEVCS